MGLDESRARGETRALDALYAVLPDRDAPENPEWRSMPETLITEENAVLMVKAGVGLSGVAAGVAAVRAAARREPNQAYAIGMLSGTSAIGLLNPIAGIAAFSILGLVAYRLARRRQ